MGIREDIESVRKYSDEVIKEKLWAAESHISVVRLIVVLFNSFIYFLVLDDELKIHWLANVTIVAAACYASYMFFYKPYKKYPLLLSRLFSVSTDGIFITLWIIATGGAASSFYMLWCLSIIAVAQRFSFKETMIASLVYAFTYYAIISLDSLHDVEIAELIVRITYIPVTGILGAYFSREIASQINDKIQNRESELKIRKILNDLDVQLQQKNEAEFQLKQVQLQLEQKVEERTNDFRILTEQLKKILRQKEKIQEEQQITLERLEHTNKELESFAYITSHDLKSPLRGIATIADWLNEDYADKFDAEGRKNITLLKQRAKKMSELLDGVLQYSRITEVNSEANVIDTYSLLHEIIRLIHPQKNISFIISDNLPYIFLNKTLLSTLFENLLTNAVIHMGKNEGKIIVDAIRKENEWVFFVMDTGQGIDARYHQKIFEMFQTLDGDKNTENKGMGLAIVKKIANGFGGRVWVESEPGKGSSFFFSLPASMIHPKKREMKKKISRD